MKINGLVWWHKKKDLLPSDKNVWLSDTLTEGGKKNWRGEREILSIVHEERIKDRRVTKEKERERMYFLWKGVLPLLQREEERERKKEREERGSVEPTPLWLLFLWNRSEKKKKPRALVPRFYNSMHDGLRSSLRFFFADTGFCSHIPSFSCNYQVICR